MCKYSKLNLNTFALSRCIAAHWCTVSRDLDGIQWILWIYTDAAPECLLLLLSLLKMQRLTDTVTSRTLQRHFTEFMQNVHWTLQCQTVSSSWNAAMASDQSKSDSRNRCAFVSLRNCSSVLAALVAGGKLFQARAATTGNAPSWLQMPTENIFVRIDCSAVHCDFSFMCTL